MYTSDIVASVSGGTKEIFLLGTVKQALTASTAYTLGTLASQYRPLKNTQQILILRLNSGTPVFAMVSIGTDGTVSMMPYSALTAGQGLQFNFCYK